MDIDQLRGILVDWLFVASDDIRRAREAGRTTEAEYITVERDLLLRILVMIDEDASEQAHGGR